MHHIHRTILVFVAEVLGLCRSDAQYSSTSSKFSLDPFLGSYDMIWSQQVNMVNFTNGVAGVPLSVTLGGERQTFNKTVDGKYQQTVGRNDSRYIRATVFELDKPESMQTPDGLIFSYAFTMVNASTLQSTFQLSSGNGTPVASFGFTFAFYSDASGFFDTATVTKPAPLVATAPFYRLKNGDTGPLTLGPP